ncbi:hypothetical protein QBC44DRAFT_322222 [Cladorrhinum sp. PSN332]|nr:hypothetical protein QBC44DRAFT_322222 [Cladorrhinum sp. PSN332]
MRRSFSQRQLLDKRLWMALWARPIGRYYHVPAVFYRQLGGLAFMWRVAAARNPHSHQKPVSFGLKLNRPASQIFEELGGGASPNTHHLVVLRSFTPGYVEELSIAIPLKLGATFHDENDDKGLGPMILTRRGDEHFLAWLVVHQGIMEPPAIPQDAAAGFNTNFGYARCYLMIWRYIRYLDVVDLPAGLGTVADQVFSENYYGATSTERWWTLDIVRAPEEIGYIRRVPAAAGFGSYLSIDWLERSLRLRNGVLMRVLRFWD